MTALSLSAARFVGHVVSTVPSAVLALPTGRTPLGMYRELVQMYADGSLDFSQTRIFNLDDIIKVKPSRRSELPGGYNYILPQSGGYAPSFACVVRRSVTPVFITRMTRPATAESA